MINMARWVLGCMAFWGLGCMLEETIPVGGAEAPAEAAPNPTSSRTAADDTSASSTEAGTPASEAPTPEARAAVPAAEMTTPAGSAAAAADSDGTGSAGMGGVGGATLAPEPRSDVIEVGDGRFTVGQPPPQAAPSALPEIVELSGPAAVTNGGAASLHVQLSTPLPSPSFVVQLDGDTGYHTVTATDPDGDGVYDISVQVAAEATQPALVFRVALTDAAGNVGPSREVEIALVQSGTGDVKITVSWDRLHDLDVRVIEPGGEEIRYTNPASATGGRLDLDSGANCGSSAANSENVFWPSAGAPAGEYVVSVHNYQQCSPGAIEYTVRVAYDNNVSTQRGTFADGTAAEAVSADSLKEVARFRRANPSPTAP